MRLKLDQLKIMKKFIVDQDSRLVLGKRKDKDFFVVAVFNFYQMHGLRRQHIEPDLLYYGTDLEWANDIYYAHRKTLSEYIDNPSAFSA